MNCCLKFQKICLSLSRSKRRSNFTILRKICFVHAQFICVYLICIQHQRNIWLKLKLFFRKTILIKENISSHDISKGLNSIKFLEILNSNKKPNIFSIHQLKITWKHSTFVRKSFLMCPKIRTPLGFKHLNFRIFLFIPHHQYPSNLH